MTTPTQAAFYVMQSHIRALNTGDDTALAATLHFPHVRLSGAGLQTWDSAESYFKNFRTRAGTTWARSSFDDIQVLSATETKVHLDVEVNRFDAQDQTISTFRSLWVITLEDGRWAAKLRSSFAAT